MTFLPEYFFASSNISFILMEIMMPATKRRIIPIRVFDMNLYKNKYAKSAPKGSDKPLIKVFFIALNFDFVEQNNGTAIAIPSG